MGFEIFPIINEIALLSLSSIVLLVGLFLKKHTTHAVFLLSLLGLLVMVWLLIGQIATPTVELYQHQYIHDTLAVILKLFTSLVMFFIFLYAYEYLQARQIPALEFFTLCLFSMLGMFILISSYSLLTMYLGLELMSLPLYALVGIYRGYPTSAEAAIKYFITGGIASGLMLYGISIIYGFTGAVDLPTILDVSREHFQDDIWLKVGMGFILVGVCFKLALVPFHMWAPDVYAGSPTPITMLISSAPKLAAFAMVVRIFTEAFVHLFSYWHEILMGLIVLSLLIGNLLAVVQNNLKRLLAYSAVAHMGYMLLGVLAGTPKTGNVASLFYVIVYALMSLASLGMLVILSSPEKEIETIDDLKGLNQRNALLAFMFLMVLLSLAGIPPLVGFLTKFLVLKAIIDVGYIKLAIFALLMAVVGAYYYLRIIKTMYFDVPEQTKPLEVSRYLTMEISVNALLLLGLGLFPVGLLQICQSVFNLY